MHGSNSSYAECLDCHLHATNPSTKLQSCSYRSFLKGDDLAMQFKFSISSCRHLYEWFLGHATLAAGQIWPMHETTHAHNIKWLHDELILS